MKFFSIAPFIFFVGCQSSRLAQVDPSLAFKICMESDPVLKYWDPNIDGDGPELYAVINEASDRCYKKLGIQ